MKTLTMNIGDEADFFRRGREIARLADQGLPIPEERVVSFGEPAELLELLTAARLTLLRSVSEQSGSIEAIAGRLQRDNGGIGCDVEKLERFGLVKVLDGDVHATVECLKLEAVIPLV